MSELIEQLAKKQGLRKYSGIFSDEYIVRAHELEAFAKAYQAAAPIDNVAEALEKAVRTCEDCMDLAEQCEWNEAITECIKQIRALIPDTQANAQPTQGQSK
jgi:hypothetical protein